MLLGINPWNKTDMRPLVENSFIEETLACQCFYRALIVFLVLTWRWMSRPLMCLWSIHVGADLNSTQRWLVNKNTEALRKWRPFSSVVFKCIVMADNFCIIKGNFYFGLFPGVEMIECRYWLKKCLVHEEAAYVDKVVTEMSDAMRRQYVIVSWLRYITDISL